MPVSVPASLIDFIREGSKFLIAGHKEPDGDCVGSELALCSALRRLGKQAIPCSAGPFKRSEIIPYAESFVSVPGESDKKGARLIVVDCFDISRTGDLAPHLEGLPAAFIDHHKISSAPPVAGEIPLFLDPNAPSATFMILSLFEALGLSPTQEESELLFFGLCTDTGFFRHVDAEGEKTFSAAARLIKAGASPKKAFQMINGGKSLESRIFMGRMLSRTQAFFDGRLIVTYEEYEDSHQFGIESRDSDSLYQLLQSIAGVQAIAIFRQETPDKCTVGLRSRDQVDVAAVAAAFGGGGHKNAAGFALNDHISNVMKKTIDMFGKTFYSK
jgi:phosphoesterase RecJ-like protein